MNPKLIELADASTTTVVIYVVVGVVAVALLVIGILLLNFISIWVRALTSGARVKISELIALRLRRRAGRPDCG